MPCIQAKVSVPTSPEQRDALKARFGRDIEAFPGKSEAWLMVTIEDNTAIYFRGDANEPSAFIEVKILGKGSDAAFDEMTERVTRSVHEELGIPVDRIYVKYEEVAHWGHAGHNF